MKPVRILLALTGLSLLPGVAIACGGNDPNARYTKPRPLALAPIVQMDAIRQTGNAYKVSTGASVAFGFAAKYKLCDYSSVQAGLQYRTSGYTQGQAIPNTALPVDVRYRSLEMPVTVNGLLGNCCKVSWGLSGGGYVGAVLRNKSEYIGQKEMASSLYRLPTSNTMYAGITGGAFVNYKVCPYTVLQIRPQYNLALRNPMQLDGGGRLNGAGISIGLFQTLSW